MGFSIIPLRVETCIFTDSAGRLSPEGLTLFFQGLRVWSCGLGTGALPLAQGLPKQALEAFARRPTEVVGRSAELPVSKP